MKVGDVIQCQGARYVRWIVLQVKNGLVYARREGSSKEKWITRPEFYRVIG